MAPPHGPMPRTRESPARRGPPRSAGGGRKTLPFLRRPGAARAHKRRRAGRSAGADRMTSFDHHVRERRIGGGILQLERFERIGDAARDEIVADVLVVGGNDEPGRPLGARALEDAAIGLGELVPALAVRQVAHAELPVLRLVRDALLETHLLLVARDVQHELEQQHTVLGQHVLEVVDLVVAGRPDLLRHEAIYARHEDILVVRSVEDPDHPLRRHLAVDAPEEVVTQLQLRGLLEAGDGAPLWVHRGQHLADRAVLTGGVTALEHDEQRAAPVGPEDALELRDARRLLCTETLELLLAPAVAGPAGVGVSQLDILLRLDRLELHAVSTTERVTSRPAGDGSCGGSGTAVKRRRCCAAARACRATAAWMFRRRAPPVTGANDGTAAQHGGEQRAAPNQGARGPRSRQAAERDERDARREQAAEGS